MATIEEPIVLLVDDNENFRDYIRDASRAQNREFQTVSTFRLAQKFAHDRPNDQLVAYIDRHLHTPEQNGLELVRYFRRVAPERVVSYLLTSDERDLTEEEALDAGAYHVFNKNTPIHRLIRYAKKSHIDKLLVKENTDRLTGLLTYGTFCEMVEAEMLATRTRKDEQHPSNFALLFFDVDYFKLFNDERGHLFGDEALRRIAATLRHNLRPGDHICRKSGDEFLVWLFGATERQAETIGRKLQMKVGETRLSDNENEPAVYGSVSFGLSCIGREEISADAHKDLERLVEGADTGGKRSLQSAKQGRR